MEQLKEKINQDGRKGKSNQVRNKLKCSPEPPPQDKISLLVGMGVYIGPILLDMKCGLSIKILGWVRSLDQGIYTNIDEDP